ncbi:Uncharacterised protein [Moraxella atlantae]|uniref:Uncharacterized protein n=1 Tax=Faucicola atlantae TaxID=34059 RepID=A0A378QLL8_9GAMM|nr:hypothetical protein B5J92_04730 [Moraxella atlantae]STZ01668.1 Uncharacterised protein [Moraxella atlantae]
MFLTEPDDMFKQGVVLPCRRAVVDVADVYVLVADVELYEKFEGSWVLHLGVGSSLGCSVNLLIN